MFKASVLRFSWVVLFSAWTLAGCVTTEEASLLSGAPFPRDAVEETLAAGFARIAEKSLEPVEVRDVAIEGLKGLASIDPALATTEQGGGLVLYLGEATLAERPAPASGDAEAWARLAADLIEIAHARSDLLRHADTEEIYESLFDGTLSQLDMFSRYAGAEEARRNRAKRDGFGGIGILFRTTADAARVTRVLRDTPAAAAGLRPGDLLTHVGAVPLAGLNDKAVAAQLRGPVGSPLSVTVRRSGEADLLAFHLNRARIVLPTVSATVEDGIAVLEVDGFNQDTADSIARHLRALERDGSRPLAGVVLDLRGNPGGLLSESIAVADLFLGEGQIISTRGRHRDSIQYYEADSEQVAAGVPLAILIDGKSASAAEIVAAALQDRGRAVVIGTVSYGKGTVQTVLRLPNDGEVTLTWSRLIAPSGYALHQLGVLPAVCTSGRGGRGEAAPVLENAVGGGVRILDGLQAWRAVAVDDKTGRRDLRRTCMPQRRPLDLERRAAVALIGNGGLFARVLALTAEPAIARRPHGGE